MLGPHMVGPLLHLVYFGVNRVSRPPSLRSFVGFIIRLSLVIGTNAIFGPLSICVIKIMCFVCVLPDRAKLSHNQYHVIPPSLFV